MEEVKRKIAGLKRRTRFIHRGEARRFAAELDALLDAIEDANPEPYEGLKMVAAFLSTDHTILNSCDDSSGYIGDVYRFAAHELFAKYASGCTQKKRVLDLMIKTYSDDPFGVRDGIITKANEYLEPAEAENAVELFVHLAREEENIWEKFHFHHAIESLARQMGDAALFEKTRLERNPEPGVAACIDIARVYLETGDPQTAFNWLNRIPENETYMDDERRELLQRVYGKLGDNAKEEEIAWLTFRKSRSMQTLENLLHVIGEDKREQVIHNEAAFIIDDGKTDYHDIRFLVDVKRFEEAEICILVKAGTRSLDGYYYSTLLPMAKAMEQAGKSLAAYVIYRALMVSILDRKFYKGYGHAAKYLGKLDLLAKKITDWQDLGAHEVFHIWLQQEHGKKSSFWNHYRGE